MARSARHVRQSMRDWAVLAQTGSAGVYQAAPAVIRHHVYHPAFGGSFGLKRVLPALIPELGYENLAVNDGQMASLELERLLLHGPEPGRRYERAGENESASLLPPGYVGLVKLLRRLRELA